MGEINFFSPYIQQEEKKHRFYRWTKLIILIVILIAGGISGAIFAKTQFVKADISKAESYLASPEIQQQKAIMELMKIRIEAGAQYFEELKDVEARIKAVDLINVKLMDTLASTLPKGAVFTELNLDVDIFTLKGTALNNRNVAEIEYNLRKTGLFKDVHVSEIEVENGVHEFTLTAIFH